MQRLRKFSYWRKALSPAEADAVPRGFVELRPPRRASGVCVEAGFDAATRLRELEALAAP